MLQLENVVSDRGSRYAVSGGAVESAAEVEAFLKALLRGKKYAKATHNTWAVVLSDGTQMKGDDGESGAGNVILRMLARGDHRADRCGDPVVRWKTPWRRPVSPCSDLCTGLPEGHGLTQVKDVR
ncbi:Uncharacterized protein family UPF0029 [Thalassovita taeanensis]|uniref:Uncharacterized protein family UPF0029 n=1 Tax=Thalassovita taeanensis TaxID=657014 RepID=A0A1H9BCA3_9RHOB|nr:Uncharacterized protein family UPF0029 [Thalassovita taeanensis]